MGAFQKEEVGDVMKIRVLIILIVVLIGRASGQITTTKPRQQEVILVPVPSEDSQNFFGRDVQKYVGNELYLKGLSETLRKYGYKGFVIDYRVDRSNIYKCCDGINSRYDALAGKYFKVLDIINHPRAAEQDYLYGHLFFLKLQEKESGDIVYFEYDSRLESAFPFIRVAFFENQKRSVLDRQFVFSVSFLRGLADLQTGKPISARIGQKWKCIDLTIEEEHFTMAMVLENLIKEKVMISLDPDIGRWRLGGYYSVADADNYRKRFGNGLFNAILMGKVSLGMTKEMCKLSWGEPQRVNRTISARGGFEQWVYSGNILYFQNNVLVTIQ